MLRYALPCLTLALAGCCAHGPVTFADYQAGVDAQLERVEILAQAGDWGGCYAAQREALRLAPDSAYVHTQIGYALWRVDPKAALRAFDLALEAGSRGMIADRPGAYFVGLDEDREAVLLHTRGLIHRRAGHPELALADFRRALELRPDPSWWERASPAQDYGPIAQVEELESEATRTE